MAAPKPLTPVTYHLLLALAGGDQHGYAVKKTVLEQSDGAIMLGAGTLYAAIRRLQRDGLIEETRSRIAPKLDDERRKYYTLTRRGRERVTAETERLRRTVRIAETRLGLRPLAPAGARA